MTRYLRPLLPALLAALTIPLAFAGDDCDGCKDYPGVSRMPGYHIRSLDESQFDSYTFTVTEAGKEKQVPVEGHTYKFRYEPNSGITPASALQIVRNYQNAARAAGGQVLWESGDSGNRTTTVRFKKGANEIWMEAEGLCCIDTVVFLNIVERQAMQQDVTVDAKSMAHDIATTGGAAIYGIYFDTGKAEVKPESEPALVQIAKLLQQTPQLKLYVVGHTDNVGTLASNMDLSRRRADAVVAALSSKHGIAPSRLSAQGAGPLAPVASNDTEDGRAKNRRVELVKQ